MHYLIDEDLSTEVALIARGLGLDAVSVQELRRRSWTDEMHLEQAAIEGRCIVTGNRDDFRRLTTEFGARDRPHAGVLVVPYTLVRRGAVAVARALAAFDRERGDFPAAYLCDSSSSRPSSCHPGTRLGAPQQGSGTLAGRRRDD